MKKLSLLLLLALYACAPAGDTTGRSSAIGGAVGAGVGGVIGAAVGDPGSGFLLGGATGATTGAAVGNLVEYKDNQIASRDEEIQRQQRLIQSQQSEIDQLRRLSKDQVVFNNTPSSSYGTTTYPTASLSSRSLNNAPTTSDYSNTYARNTTSNSLVSGSFNNSSVASSKSIEPAKPLTTASAMPQAKTSWSNDFAPKINNTPVDPQVAGTIKSTPTVEQTGSQLALNSTNTNPSSSAMTDARFSADVRKLEPLASGTFGDSTEKTLAKPLEQKTEEVAPIREDEKPLVKAEVELPKPAVEKFEQADFAMGSFSGAITSPAESNQAVSFNEITEMKTEASQKPASTRSSVECQDAEKEVHQAAAIKEVADKLYHYRRALRLCPNDSEFHNGLGEVYLSLNRKDDAKFEFEEALRLDSANSKAQGNLQKVAN